jgi:hypothetical protein
MTYMQRRNFLQMSALGPLASLLPSESLASTTLLTVSGDVAGQSPYTFDDQDLSALEQVEFSTTTIWTPGPQKFSGPSLKTLLETVGAGPGPLSLQAVNDYSVILSQDMIEENAPIIANRINDRTFSVREKGPLWLVFPYDRRIDYQQEEVYAVSVWQLTQITVFRD